MWKWLDMESLNGEFVYLLDHVGSSRDIIQISIAHPLLYFPTCEPNQPPIHPSNWVLFAIRDPHLSWLWGWKVSSFGKITAAGITNSPHQSFLWSSRPRSCWTLDQGTAALRLCCLPSFLSSVHQSNPVKTQHPCSCLYLIQSVTNVYTPPCTEDGWK